jgi:hypothetical protein
MLKVTIPFALYWRTTASVAEGSVGEASAPSRMASGATVVRKLLSPGSRNGSRQLRFSERDEEDLLPELPEGAERQRPADRKGEDRQGKVGRCPHRIDERTRDKAGDPWVQDQARDDVSTHPGEPQLPHELPEDIAQQDRQARCQESGHVIHPLPLDGGLRLRKC